MSSKFMKVWAVVETQIQYFKHQLKFGEFGEKLKFEFPGIAPK